jgi:AraC-like DNA-binding protein
MSRGLDTRISVAELCQIDGVSERSLQYAFRQEYGMSPTGFMRKRRLHAVRQELTRSAAEHTTLSAIAIKYRFS